MRKLAKSVFLVAIVAGLTLASAPALAQAPNAPETFGSTPVAHTLQAFEFQGFAASFDSNIQGNAFGSRFCNGGAGCFFEAPLRLPAGAIIDSLILDGCDTHAAGDIAIQLRRIGAGEASNVQMALAVSSGQPGCSATLATATPAAHTIDNVAFSYWVEVAFGVTVGELRFQAVRVMYHLQVSPTPVTDTFDDVPVGHPFHRFIEAFARAGITGGCNASPPLFCPDSFVTRGQMAVFLSVALGLHWTP